MTEYTMEQLKACADREVKYRRYVFPRRVEQQKMTQAQADREIGMMEAIAKHYAELAERERLL
jgi:hypothetical protein